MDEEDRHAKHKVLNWIKQTRRQEQDPPQESRMRTRPLDTDATQRRRPRPASATQHASDRKEGGPLPAPRLSSSAKLRGSNAKERSFLADSDRQNEGSVQSWIRLNESDASTTPSPSRDAKPVNQTAPESDDVFSFLRAYPLANLLSFDNIATSFAGKGIEELEGSRDRSEGPSKPDNPGFYGPDETEPSSIPRTSGSSQRPDHFAQEEPEWVLMARRAMRKAQSLTQSASRRSSAQNVE